MRYSTSVWPCQGRQIFRWSTRTTRLSHATLAGRHPRGIWRKDCLLFKELTPVGLNSFPRKTAGHPGRPQQTLKSLSVSLRLIPGYWIWFRTCFVEIGFRYIVLLDCIRFLPTISTIHRHPGIWSCWLCAVRHADSTCIVIVHDQWCMISLLSHGNGLWRHFSPACESYTCWCDVMWRKTWLLRSTALQQRAKSSNSDKK